MDATASAQYAEASPARPMAPARGAQMVDEKSRHGLAHARGRVEQSHEEAQLRVGHAEVLAEEGKERRQHELEKVADEVGGAHERNDAHVTSQTAANRF